MKQKKHKISISIGAETLQKVQDGVGQGRFRNASHAFEYAINQLDLEGEDHE